MLDIITHYISRYFRQIVEFCILVFFALVAAANWLGQPRAANVGPVQIAPSAAIASQPEPEARPAAIPNVLPAEPQLPPLAPQPEMKLTPPPSGRGIGATALELVSAPPTAYYRVSFSSPPQADGVFKRLPIKKPAENRILDAYKQLIIQDNPQLDDDLVDRLAKKYREEEDRYGFFSGLLLAVAHIESKHDPDAVSKKDAWGLMQIQYRTGREWTQKIGVWQEPKPKKLPAKASPEAKKLAAKEFRKTSAQAEKQLRQIIFEPSTNIRLGAEVLNCYLDEADGDLNAALHRYSGGASNYAAKVKHFHQLVMALAETEPL